MKLSATVLGIISLYALAFLWAWHSDAAQIDHRRGHLTVTGELQERWRSTDGVTKPQPLFWLNTLTLVAEPGSDLEKFLEAHVGTRVTVTIKPE